MTQLVDLVDHDQFQLSLMYLLNYYIKIRIHM